jgi:hypothetical protein
MPLSVRSERAASAAQSGVLRAQLLFTGWFGPMMGDLAGSLIRHLWG